MQAISTTKDIIQNIGKIFEKGLLERIPVSIYWKDHRI